MRKNTILLITQQWECFKIQTEEEDIECIMEIIKKIDDEIVDKERKRHLKSLQNIDKVFLPF